LAWLKAKAVAELPESKYGELLLAADTVCAVDDVILGQPEDRNDARRMLQAMRGRSHEVWTGMCVLPVGGVRRIGTSVTRVHLGELSDADIEAYLDTDQWQAKAGGYNFSDRIDAGWPLSCTGDSDTVMGLSLTLLEQLLSEVAA
jgi:septum formation protein